MAHAHSDYGSVHVRDSSVVRLSVPRAELLIRLELSLLAISNLATRVFVTKINTNYLCTFRKLLVHQSLIFSLKTEMITEIELS